MTTEHLLLRVQRYRSRGQLRDDAGPWAQLRWVRTRARVFFSLLGAFVPSCLGIFAVNSDTESDSTPVCLFSRCVLLAESSVNSGPLTTASQERGAFQRHGFPIREHVSQRVCLV